MKTARLAPPFKTAIFHAKASRWRDAYEASRSRTRSRKGEAGFGGIFYGPQSFALYVDPSSNALRLKTRFNAAATTVHELHHCLRQRTCPLRPYDQMRAGDVLILEGLTVQSEEFLGFAKPRAVQGVSVDKVLPLIDRIADVVSDPEANWAWAYEKNGLKHGALYAMGYHIVSSYLLDMKSPRSWR